MIRWYHPIIPREIRLITSLSLENGMDLFWTNVGSDHPANSHLKIASIKRNRNEAQTKFDVTKFLGPVISEQFLNVIKESVNYDRYYRM